MIALPYFSNKPWTKATVIARNEVSGWLHCWFYFEIYKPRYLGSAGKQEDPSNKGFPQSWEQGNQNPHQEQSPADPLLWFSVRVSLSGTSLSRTATQRRSHYCSHRWQTAQISISEYPAQTQWDKWWKQPARVQSDDPGQSCAPVSNTATLLQSRQSLGILLNATLRWFLFFTGINTPRRVMEFNKSSFLFQNKCEQNNQRKK